MFVIPNNTQKQIRISRPTRFRGIQETARNSSCKHVDDRSHPIFSHRAFINISH